MHSNVLLDIIVNQVQEYRIQTNVLLDFTVIWVPIDPNCVIQVHLLHLPVLKVIPTVPNVTLVLTVLVALTVWPNYLVKLDFTALVVIRRPENPYYVRVVIIVHRDHWKPNKMEVLLLLVI